MQWSVERLNDSMARGPRARFAAEGVEVIEADGFSVESGALIFIVAGDIVRAFGPGAWATVVRVDEDQQQGQGEGPARPGRGN